MTGPSRSTREALGFGAVLLVAVLSYLRAPSFLPDLPALALSPIARVLARTTGDGSATGRSAGVGPADAASWSRVLFRSAIPPPDVAPGWGRVPARVHVRIGERGLLEVVLPPGSPVREGCPVVWGESLLGLVDSVRGTTARIEPLGRGRTPIPVRLHFLGDGGRTRGPRALLRPSARPSENVSDDSALYLDRLEDPEVLETIDPALDVELRTIEPAYLLDGAPLLPDGLLAGVLEPMQAAHPDTTGVSSPGTGSVPATERLCRPRLSPFVPDVFCVLVPDAGGRSGEDAAAAVAGPDPIGARVVGTGWVGPGMRTLWLTLEEASPDAVRPNDAVLAGATLTARILRAVGAVAFARDLGSGLVRGTGYVDGPEASVSRPCGRLELEGRVGASGVRGFRIRSGPADLASLATVGSRIRLSPADRPLLPPPVLGEVRTGRDGERVIRVPSPPRPGAVLQVRGSTPRDGREGTATAVATVGP